MNRAWHQWWAGWHALRFDKHRHRWAKHKAHLI